MDPTQDDLDLAGVDDDECEEEMFLCSPSQCFFCDAVYDSGEKVTSYSIMIKVYSLGYNQFVLSTSFILDIDSCRERSLYTSVGCFQAGFFHFL